MTRIFCVCLCVALQTFLARAIAQDTLVNFDRPNNGTGPYIVPKNSLQFEFGTSYNSVTGLNETVFPSLFFRIPIFRKTELRFNINYEPQSNIFIFDNIENGHDPLAIGFKHKLLKEKKIAPELSLMAHLFYPIQKLNVYLPTELNSDIWLLAQKNLTENHSLNASLGYSYANIRLKNSVIGTFSYNYILVKNVVLFAEYFVFHYFDLNKTEHGFDVGAAYEFGKKFQVDLSYYYNHDQIHQLGFIECGLAYNLKYKNIR